MNIQKQINIGTCVMLALMSSSVQSSPTRSADSRSASDYTSFLEGQSLSKVAASRDYSFGGMENSSLLVRKSQVNNLSIGISQSEIFIRNGRASFTLYSPTSKENPSMPFAKPASDSQINGVWVTVIQALSLAVTRQVNTEFTYSMPVSKNSKFDSAINYRLGPINDFGAPGMAASFQYNGKF